MVDSIFKMLASVLAIVEEKVRRKYQEKVYNLSQEWYEEKKKPLAIRDNARIDAIKRELRLILDNFSAELKPKNS